MKLKSVTVAGEITPYQRGSLSIAQIKGIERINWYTYTIPSKDGVTRYVIGMDKEMPEFAVTCSCPIFSNRPDQACKHMIAVERNPIA